MKEKDYHQKTMEQLGIEPTIIGMQIVNFFILYVVMKKYLYKPILGILEKRSSTVMKNNKLRQTLENTKKELEDTQKKVLKNAQKESDKILKEAKSKSAKEKRLQEKEAKLEAKRIIEKAKESAKIKTKLSKEALKNQMEEVVLNVTEDLLPITITEAQRRTITQKALKQFLQN